MSDKILQASGAGENGLSLPLVPSKFPLSLNCLHLGPLPIIGQSMLPKIWNNLLARSELYINLLKEECCCGKDNSTCTWTGTEKGLSSPKGNRGIISRN